MDYLSTPNGRVALEVETMELNKVIQGDCLNVLKTLPDKSINCCVTSPPYYGLRDYGTGKWIGGNEKCFHDNAVIKSCFDYSMNASAVQTHNKGTDKRRYKAICPDCGAVRVDEQIGLEETPEEYVEKLVNVFHEVKRVLKDDGTLWLNIGDSYAAQRGGTYQPAETLSGGIHGKTIDGKKTNRGRSDGYNPTRNAAAIGLKHKDLIGIPWLLAFALRSDGWYLRQDIIWHKPNPMPESVTDRCTKSHEYIFLLSKNKQYYFDNESIKEQCISNTKGGVFGGKKYGSYDDKHFQTYSGKEWSGSDKRNKRDVWTVPVNSFKEAHFATFPEKLIEPCILAGSPPGGVVLDPFFGSGTTGRVAIRLNRQYLGIELNPEYVKISDKRTDNIQLQILFNE